MLSQYLFGKHSSRCTNTRQKWRDATPTGSYQLRRKQHLYMKTPRLLKATRDISLGGTHHHPRHWTDEWCNIQRIPEDADHSPVLGLSCTGRQIRRASHANACIRFNTWLTMVPQTKSWHRLGSIDSLWLPSASGAEEWHRWLRQWHRRSHKLKLITIRSMTSFWGAVQVYRHSEQPHSTIFQLALKSS